MSRADCQSTCGQKIWDLRPSNSRLAAGQMADTTSERVSKRTGLTALRPQNKASNKLALKGHVMSKTRSKDARNTRFVGVVAFSLLTTFLALSMGPAGCGLDMSRDMSLGPGDAATQPADELAQSPDPSITTVTIRFRNFAVTEAVNVEFYASNNPLAEIPDDLFVEENLVTSSIGVAGTGILEPLSEDTLDFLCTGDLVLGSLGGSFLDNETGDQLGEGEPRWAQDSALELCGREVLFEFSSVAGEFSVRISISD